MWQKSCMASVCLSFHCENFYEPKILIYYLYNIFSCSLSYLSKKKTTYLGGFFSIYHCLLEEELELLELLLLDSELSSEELVLSNCSGWSA